MTSFDDRSPALGPYSGRTAWACDVWEWRERGGLDQLQTLGLCYAGNTDAGLEHLRRMKQLRSVVLYGTQVTAAGVAKLRQALPNCKIVRNPQ